jgi:hypothetical protein
MDDSNDGDGNNKSGDEDGQEFSEEDEGEDDDILENDIQPPEYRKRRSQKAKGMCQRVKVQV